MATSISSHAARSVTRRLRFRTEKVRLAYKTSKGAINSMTQHMAFENARYGIRINAILPGLMDTPMAIERRVKERNLSREQVRAERGAQVPLLVANAGNAFDWPMPQCSSPPTRRAISRACFCRSMAGFCSRSASWRLLRQPVPCSFMIPTWRR